MQIIYTKQAVKQINALDGSLKQRVKAGIEGLPNGDIKKLRGYSGLFRLRIGNYRIVYEASQNTVTINAVLPRGDVYKQI